MKKKLDLKFYYETQLEETPVIKSIFYSGKFTNRIRMNSLDEYENGLRTYKKTVQPFIK